jgi:uncharacterized damage-inducible protein DinB
MTPPVQRFLRYDVWANRETLKSLQQGSPPAKSLRWIGHIIGSEFLWLDRIDGRPQSLPVWPELSLDECDIRLGQLSQLLPAAARSGDIARPVRYTNTKGESWTSSVEEILTHVTIHSAYHRGQIASDVRSAGREPAYTDYIHAVRQRILE